MAKPSLYIAVHQGQNQPAGNDRRDLARDVDADRVHQQEILVVLSQAHLVDDAPAHRERGNACRADHRVDFFALGQEQIQQLGKENAAGGVKNKRDQTQRQDQQCVRPDEFVGGHLARHGQAQHNRDKVRQYVLRGLRQGVQHAALAQQVAEHEKTDQRHAGGGYQPGQHSDHNREQNFGGFADIALLIWHPDQPLFFRCAQADDWRLHDGHKRHVAVRRDHDGTQVFAAQCVRHEDSRRTVCRTDDGDGGRVGQVKEQPRQHKCDKNAELRRRTEQHEPRLFQQRAKVDHRADADEKQQREQLVGHTGVKKRVDRANGFALCDGTGQRQVDEDGTEAHGQQQARLHLFGDGKVDQQATDDPHDHHLPGEVAEVCEQPGKGLEKLHTGPSRILGGREQKRDPCRRKSLRQKSQCFSMPRGQSPW